MTLVEVLAALALLSMLVAATSSLTGYIARTSAERQAEATARNAIGAAIDLIAADLDAWNAAHTSSEGGGGDRPPAVATGSGVELRFPSAEGRPQPTITYRFDKFTGRLTRDDISDPMDQPRDVMGGLTVFDVAVTESIRSVDRRVLRIQISAAGGITRSITAWLPPEEASDG